MRDFLNSWIAMLNEMVAKAIMSRLFGAVINMFANMGTSAVTGNGMSFAGSGASESASLGLMRHGHALGDVFTGLHGYANQIVTRPTLFSYGSQLTRYAKGGVMGEAGPEAVMPLTRMSNGSLGVRAAGAGGGEISLSLTIVDQTKNGVDAENAQAAMNGIKMDVIVNQIDSKIAGMAASGKSKFMSVMEKTHRMPSTRGWS